jgi:MOSC domain-containing protein YiiM
MATILSVSRSDMHGFAKQPHPRIRLIEGQGVEGDAHCGVNTQHLYLKRKNPLLPNLCQVHLFAAEMLDELASKGFALHPGELGENVLTQGIDLLALPEGTQLHLGEEAIVQITGLRTPCSKIDAFRSGLQQHLWGPRNTRGKRTRRAGVMSVVKRGGDVSVGDSLRIVLPPLPHRSLGPV